MRTGAVGGAVAVIRRPSLWVTGVVEMVRLTPSRWWTRRPFLPIPDRSLMDFRAETQYGDSGHGIDSRDLITWLEFCRAENRRSRRRGVV